MKSFLSKYISQGFSPCFCIVLWISLLSYDWMMSYLTCFELNKRVQRFELGQGGVGCFILSDKFREWKLGSFNVKPVTFTIYLEAFLFLFFVSVIWEVGFGITLPWARTRSVSFIPGPRHFEILYVYVFPIKNKQRNKEKTNHKPKSH